MSILQLTSMPPSLKGANSFVTHLVNYEDHTYLHSFISPFRKLWVSSTWEGNSNTFSSPFQLVKQLINNKKGSHTMLQQELSDTHACRSGQGRDLSSFHLLADWFNCKIRWSNTAQWQTKVGVISALILLLQFKAFLKHAYFLSAASKVSSFSSLSVLQCTCVSQRETKKEPTFSSWRTWQLFYIPLPIWHRDIPKIKKEESFKPKKTLIYGLMYSHQCATGYLWPT